MTLGKHSDDEDLEPTQPFHAFDREETIEDAEVVPDEPEGEGKEITITEKAFKQLLTHNALQGQLLGQAQACKLGQDMIDTILVRDAATITQETAQSLTEVYGVLAQQREASEADLFRLMSEMQDAHA